MRRDSRSSRGGCSVGIHTRACASSVVLRELVFPLAKPRSSRLVISTCHCGYQYIEAHQYTAIVEPHVAAGVDASLSLGGIRLHCQSLSQPLCAQAWRTWMTSDGAESETDAGLDCFGACRACGADDEDLSLHVVAAARLSLRRYCPVHRSFRARCRRREMDSPTRYRHGRHASHACVLPVCGVHPRPRQERFRRRPCNLRHLVELCLRHPQPFSFEAFRRR